jgi:hypothetical protein
MQTDHDVAFRSRYTRSYFILVLQIKWTSDCEWTKRRQIAKMSKVGALIFPQRLILRTKLRHKKYSVRRVLSEYESNSKLEQEKVGGQNRGLISPLPS